MDQAKKFFNENSPQFIDARDNWDFSDGHIKSAINIPEFSFEPTDSVLAGLDKSAKYVVYCSSNDCDISKRLASEMQKLGFSSLFVFLDGYEVWLQNKLPIDSEVSND